jgi:hypothetical protein
VKVLTPTRLLQEAAEVLAPVRDVVVVVGAAALEVALTDAVDVAITPTRDVDIVVPTDRAAEVVSYLEDADLKRSDIPYERPFTWVRGDLKVQLVRTFHPLPKSPAKELPENPAFGMAAEPAHQLTIAFTDDPTAPRLRCANAACVLALKDAAFGRTRPPDGAPVERDYHDAYLLISAVPDIVVADLEVSGYEVRQRAFDAISQLAAGDRATIAAARQMMSLGVADSQRAGEAAVRRAAVQIQRRINLDQ